MSAYRLTADTDFVVRVLDGASIPADPRNGDWQAYQAWLIAGNVPDNPDPVAAPAPGSPPITAAELAAVLIQKAKQGSPLTEADLVPEAIAAAVAADQKASAIIADAAPAS